jgi:hypothetical protein
MDDDVLANICDNLPVRDFEKREFGEVMTPMELIKPMLKTLPKSIWNSPNERWFDPAAGTGNFPIVIYYLLMTHLKSIPEKKRSKHIIEKMLFLNELNPENAEKCRRIFKLIDPDAHLNLTIGDYLRREPTVPFPTLPHKSRGVAGGTAVPLPTIIVGNPPYNDKSNTIYDKFVEKAIHETERFLLFVIPSRWFAGGRMAEFREMMTQRRDIVSIHHIPDSRTVWPSVVITGGVNYFLIDKTHNGLTDFNGAKIQLNKYDILVPDPRAYPIIDSVLSKPKITDIYLPIGHFGITTNSPYLTDNPKLVRCYVSQKKGGVRYVAAKHIANDFAFWKVITPHGSGKGGDGFGRFIICGPNEIGSQTFITFRVGSEREAKSLVRYLESDYVQYLLNLRKIDQHISKTTLAWIPREPTVAPKLTASRSDATSSQALMTASPAPLLKRFAFICDEVARPLPYTRKHRNKIQNNRTKKK